MMERVFSRLTCVTLGALLIMSAGCITGTTAPSRFYVLSAMPSSGEQAQAFSKERCMSIGIGPVEVAQYLDRPQIVTRLSPNEVTLGEFDKWAEPLKDNVTRVLAENLSALLCTDPISVFPWRGSTLVDYRVEVEVLLLDGNLGEHALLVARWAIFDENDKNMLLTRKSSFSESTGGQGYEAFVSAQSRALAALSKEIAEGIKTVLPEI
jgi:uncharacterized lipoprotein YmbA